MIEKLLIRNFDKWGTPSLGLTTLAVAQSVVLDGCVDKGEY